MAFQIISFKNPKQAVGFHNIMVPPHFAGGE
jgi:hypothetical protein